MMSKNESLSFQISAKLAKQKLVSYLLDEVSLLIGPQEPSLVFVNSNSSVWRFPIVLSMGKRGQVGQIGLINVDANDGKILLNDETLARIKTNARLLAQRLEPL